MKPETPVKAFGRQVGKSREARGWNQGELAERAGMSRETINRIETGNRGRRVDLDEALLLAYVLDVAPVHLIVPREDAASVRISADVEIEAPAVRAWLRGSLFPTDPDPDEWADAFDFFGTQVPPDELRILRGPLRSLHHRAQTVLELVDDLASHRSLPKKGDFKYLDEEVRALQEELGRVKRMKPPAKKRRKEA